MPGADTEDAINFADVFISHYTNTNWYYGKKKMKDWKAAMRSAWKLHEFITNKNKQNDTVGRIQRSELQEWVTSYERAYLEAKEQARICDITMQMFKSLIARTIVISGIKQLPSVEEVQMLFTNAIHYHPYMTIGEYALAFEMNAAGVEFTRVENFGMITIAFQSDVLKNYTNVRNKMNIDLEKKKTKMETPVQQYNEPIDWKEMFQTDIARWKNNERNAVMILAPNFIAKFYELELINDDCWTDDQWKQWKFAARFQVIEEKKLTKTRIERMNKEEKHSFNLSVQNELMRRLYADIMDSTIMQERIMSKL